MNKQKQKYKLYGIYRTQALYKNYHRLYDPCRKSAQTKIVSDYQKK